MWQKNLAIFLIVFLIAFVALWFYSQSASTNNGSGTVVPYVKTVYALGKNTNTSIPYQQLYAINVTTGTAPAKSLPFYPTCLAIDDATGTVFVAGSTSLTQASLVLYAVAIDNTVTQLPRTSTTTPPAPIALSGSYAYAISVIGAKLLISTFDSSSGSTVLTTCDMNGWNSATLSIPNLNLATNFTITSMFYDSVGSALWLVTNDTSGSGAATQIILCSSFDPAAPSGITVHPYPLSSNNGAIISSVVALSNGSVYATAAAPTYPNGVTSPLWNLNLAQGTATPSASVVSALATGSHNLTGSSMVYDSTSGTFFVASWDSAANVAEPILTATLPLSSSNPAIQTAANPSAIDPSLIWWQVTM